MGQYHQALFNNLHVHLEQSYGYCDCYSCAQDQLNLALKDDLFEKVLNAGKKAIQHLLKTKNYKSDDLQNVSEYKDLIRATQATFNEAINLNVSNENLRTILKGDAYKVGVLKTHAQLYESSLILENGGIKPLYQVEQELLAKNITYNKTYLQAEYYYATGAAQMSEKWTTFKEDETRYYLQYRTASDDKVRDSHANLHGTTLPKSDPFWNNFYPPNGWRCRCSVVEVLASRYDKTNSEKAIEAGEKATIQIGKNGKNKLEIFRNNVGKNPHILPKGNAYEKVPGAKELFKITEGITNQNKRSINLNDYIKGEFPTNKEIKNILTKYAELFPEDFRNGLEDIKFRKSTSYMMQHSMSYKPTTNEWSGGSTITISNHTFSSINFNPLEELRNGFGNLRKGEILTFNQEYAFESLWHEILHAKTKSKPQKLSVGQIKDMETINQFVARHTYNQFLNKLGGKATNQTEILNNGYGYKKMVGDFRSLLEKKNINEKDAYKKLTPFLMDNYGTVGKKTMKYIKENTK